MASFPLPDGQQLVVTIFGDIAAGSDREGWSVADISVAARNGKKSRTLAVVTYRRNEDTPSAPGVFSVITFDGERKWPEYKP